MDGRGSRWGECQQRHRKNPGAGYVGRSIHLDAFSDIQRNTWIQLLGCGVCKKGGQDRPISIADVLASEALASTGPYYLTFSEAIPTRTHDWEAVNYKPLE